MAGMARARGPQWFTKAPGQRMLLGPARTQAGEVGWCTPRKETQRLPLLGTLVYKGKQAALEEVRAFPGKW